MPSNGELNGKEKDNYAGRGSYRSFGVLILNIFMTGHDSEYPKPWELSYYIKQRPDSVCSIHRRRRRMTSGFSQNFKPVCRICRGFQKKVAMHIYIYIYIHIQYIYIYTCTCTYVYILHPKPYNLSAKLNWPATFWKRPGGWWVWTQGSGLRFSFEC